MPRAYAYPADMRATRDLMRRRLLFVRQRGSLLAHIQITHHQYNVDPPGKRITYRSNREGLGEAFEDSSVRHSIAADLALADHYEVTIGELELAVLRQARIHDPNALALLTSVPGIGKILALTMPLRDPRHLPLPVRARLRLLLPPRQV
jgi:transposase